MHIFLFVKKGGNSMAGLNIEQFILAIILGVLAAIVYSLRVLVLMERRVANMEMHLEKIAERTLREEQRIEESLTKRSKKK